VLLLDNEIDERIIILKGGRRAFLTARFMIALALLQVNGDVLGRPESLDRYNVGLGYYPKEDEDSNSNIQLPKRSACAETDTIWHRHHLLQIHCDIMSAFFIRKRTMDVLWDPGSKA
jgi:hypothetical protein